MPFFRFPGFGSSPATTAYLQAHGIATFGAELWASDWIPMTPDAEFDRLMARVRVAGRGIILLHDIKRQTADRLPRFLAAQNFHLVPMVPGGTATPTRRRAKRECRESPRAGAGAGRRGPDLPSPTDPEAVPGRVPPPVPLIAIWSVAF